MNIDFSAHPGFSLYFVLLALSGVLMVGIGATAFSRLGNGWRIFNVIAGIAFFGYAFYLAFLFQGGTYIIFFKAFILPAFMVINAIRSSVTRRNTQVLQQNGWATPQQQGWAAGPQPGPQQSWAAPQQQGWAAAPQPGQEGADAQRLVVRVGGEDDHLVEGSHPARIQLGHVTPGVKRLPLGEGRAGDERVEAHHARLPASRCAASDASSRPWWY